MIISRRRFEAEINKAVAQKEDEMWRSIRHDDEMRNMWEAIHALEGRVYKLEPKENHPCDNIAYRTTRA